MLISNKEMLLEDLRGIKIRKEWRERMKVKTDLEVLAMMEQTMPYKKSWMLKVISGRRIRLIRRICLFIIIGIKLLGILRPLLEQLKLDNNSEITNMNSNYLIWLMLQNSLVKLSLSCMNHHK